MARTPALVTARGAATRATSLCDPLRADQAVDRLRAHFERTAKLSRDDPPLAAAPGG